MVLDRRFLSKAFEAVNLPRVLRLHDKVYGNFTKCRVYYVCLHKYPLVSVHSSSKHVRISRYTLTITLFIRQIVTKRKHESTLYRNSYTDDDWRAFVCIRINAYWKATRWKDVELITTSNPSVTCHRIPSGCKSSRRGKKFTLRDWRVTGIGRREKSMRE